MPSSSIALLLAAAAMLVIAAAHDAAFRTIPNVLTAILALCGIALRAEAGDLAAAVLAALAVFAAALFCWRRGWMGGGDAKLLTAAALLAPPGQIPMMLAWIAVAGGLLALPYLIARRRMPLTARSRSTAMLARIARAERWRLRRGGPLPYAIAIAAGTAIVLLQGYAS